MERFYSWSYVQIWGRVWGEFPESDLKVKVHITTHNVRRKTYNVIGYIDGAVEPGETLSTLYTVIITWLII